MGVAAKSVWHRRTARFRKGDTEDTTIDITDDAEADALDGTDPVAATESEADPESDLEDVSASVDQASTNDN